MPARQNGTFDKIKLLCTRCDIAMRSEIRKSVETSPRFGRRSLLFAFTLHRRLRFRRPVMMTRGGFPFSVIDLSSDDLTMFAITKTRCKCDEQRDEFSDFFAASLLWP